MTISGGGLYKFCHILSVALFIGTLSTYAFAQSEPPQQRAQKLFTDALQLMQSDHCQDAIPLFLESQKLDSAAATLANLATCFAHVGKTGSAYYTYRQAARAAILENKPELQKRADEAAASLGPSLTKVRIVPQGNAGVPIIRVNGQLIDDVAAPIPLDPGENIIEATAPGREPWRKSVSAQGEGTLIVVEVPDLSLSSEPPKPLAAKNLPTLPAPVRESTNRTDLKPYAILATGIGATGLAIGTVLAFGASSKQSASNAYCDGRYCTQQGIDLRQQATDRATLATWSVGIGLASVGTAAVLWVVSARQSEHAAALSVSPWADVGRGSAGIAFEGKL